MGNTSAKPHPRPRNKKQVHWKAADRPARPGKPQLVSEVESTPDVITIRWDRPPKDGGSPITGYLVEHRRTGSPHWVRATPLLVPFPEVTLSGLEPGWRYQFRVSAENAVGMSDPSDLSEPLTVTLQRSAVTSPRFTQELTDTVALENEKIEFVVYFLGQPVPKISWYKDGFEIFSSRRIRILTESDRSVLTVHQCQLGDAGEIKCTATNKGGHASTKSTLTLEAPPSIRLPRQYEDGLLFEIGEDIRLKVSVAGLPTPLVFWSHDGESIQNDERYEIEDGDKSSTLKIGVAKRSDRGEYQIKAMNKLGQDSASFLVTVTDKPSPPGKAKVVMALGRSVTLSWNSPKDDGGCKIGNYIIEYYRIGWDVWLKASTSRQLTTMLGELIEGSQYKFRVKAESPYGVSEPGEESDVLFIPDTKRGILIPPQRSVSQPRDISNETPVLPQRKHKPRSQSSSRVDSGTNLNPNVPLRPERTKIKSPPKTPEVSPRVVRREIHDESINRAIFDRSSMTRDLAYGSPEIKVKKNELYTSEFGQKRTPSPTINNPTHIMDYKRQKSPSPRDKSRSPSPNTYARERSQNSSPRFGRLSRGNTETGSSEFMLVLLPDEHKDHKSYDEFNFEENLIPPPLSLSAPELGTEPPIILGLKYSSSSTELMHERAMIRFYEAAEAEEKSLKKDFVKKEAEERRHSVIPKIQINNQDDEDIVGLERKLSLRRRYSAGVTAPQQVLWTHRRHSLRNSTELNEILDSKLRKYPASLDAKRDIMMNRKRSESEEKEEEEFEKVRARMSQNRSKSTNKKDISVVDVKKWEVDQQDNEYEESVSDEETESSEDERIYEQVPDDLKEEEDEDFTYHPKTMNANEPFEILTKPKKLPDLNFVPKPILKNVDVGNEQRERSLSLAAKNDDKILGKKGNLPFNDSVRRGSSPVVEKERTQSHHISAIASISGITAAGVIIPKPLLAKKKSDEEARVMAEHYADIVRNYSQKRNFERQSKIDENSFETNGHIRKNSESSTQRSLSPAKPRPRRGSPAVLNKDVYMRGMEINPSKKSSSPPRTRNEFVSNHPKRNNPSPMRDFSTQTRISPPSKSPSPIRIRAPKMKEIMTQTSTCLDTFNTKTTIKESVKSWEDKELSTKVRTTIDYITDLTMFFVACWLYIFKNELLAIPVLLVMVYRQLQDEVKKRIPKWLLPKPKET